MEFIFEILIEGFFELAGEGFLKMFSAFIPENISSKKRKTIICIVGLSVSVLFLVLLFMGIALLVETKGQSLLGWLFIALNVIYALAAIIVKIVSAFKG